jgi:hypothetical protein
MNRIRRAFTATAFMLAVVAPAFAQERSADITFSGGSIAAGIGYTWGDGTLHFRGKAYPFTVRGLSVADVGIDRIDGAGDVYNLQRVEDFSGNYVAASADATVGGGGGLAMLENQKGVRIYVRSTTQGLKLNLSADGVAVALR